MVNDISLEKTLPYNIEVERHVLGWILATGKMDVSLEPDDFYLESHRRIWNVVMEMVDRGEGPDLISVVNALQKKSELESCGGAAYVASLSDCIPIYKEGLSGQYCNIIREKRAMRIGIQVGNELMARCYDDSESFRDIVNDVFGKLDIELSRNEKTEGPKPIGELIKTAFENIEAIAAQEVGMGMKTGFADVDRMILQGIQLRDFVIIAGRPSMGKSSLLMNMIRKMAKDGNPSVVFSLEMSVNQLILRMIAEVARVPLSKLATGFLNKEDWRRISMACADLSQLPMWIDDSPGLTVSDMRSRVRRIRSATPIKIIGVDYLQLVLPSKYMSNRSDAEKISSISVGLKNMAKSMDTALFAAAQLSRESEKRKDNKPKISDLRQSGQIEQDADIIFLLHRPDLHDDNREQTGMAEVILGKQRNGPTGSVEMKFSGEYSCFDQVWEEEDSTHRPQWYND